MKKEMKSNTSQCSPVLLGSNLDLKEPMLYQLPHGTNPGGMKKIEGTLNKSQW